MNYIIASRRGVKIVELLLYRQADGNQVCEFNGVKMNPYCGIKLKKNNSEQKIILLNYAMNLFA